MDLKRSTSSDKDLQQWDIQSIEIEPVAFSNWGIETPLLETFISYVRKEGIGLQGNDKALLTFADLKIIVRYLYEKGHDTSDLNAAISNVLGQQSSMSREDFKAVVEQLYKQKRIKVRDDLQKKRWGGKSMANDFELTATVIPATLPGYYSVEATIKSRSGLNPLKGWVAFFIHDSFVEEIKYVEVKKERATLQLKNCYEAFTLGSYLEDGTQLELDLNEVPGYPEGFYWKNLSEFQRSVKHMYEQKPVTVRDDLQKDRWGGRSSDKDKTLSAMVKQSWVPGFFTVHLQIICKYPGRLTGEAAFFVHDTFGREIRFVRVKDGVAELKLKAYEAFTVGAYTQDGTSLELNLNEVPEFPRGFYYKKNTTGRKAK
jgi:hypothetical protein